MDTPPRGSWVTGQPEVEDMGEPDATTRGGKPHRSARQDQRDEGDHLLTLKTPGSPEGRWWLRDTRAGDTIRVHADPTKAKPRAKAPCGTVTVE
ncbi:MAG: hypothetical protein JRI68_25120 [Deltaproteobacteria bacterium]|nr:hypothetical protein [Deltaproteobacteria bacterium]